MVYNMLITCYYVTLFIYHNATSHETQLSATIGQKERLATFCRPFIINKKVLIRQQQRISFLEASEDSKVD